MITELHAHVFMDGIDYQKSAARFKNGVDTDAVRSALSEYQKRGITFVRDGGDHFGACSYAKSIAQEYGITYLMPVFALYKEGNYGKVAGVPYKNLKEYQALVLKAKSLGADFIKIMVSGILDFNRFGVVSETDYTLGEVKELVRIAHEEGFAVMAHASGTEKARMRIKYRCPNAYHCNEIHCDHKCSDSPYGRVVHVATKDNPRIFTIPPRESKEWKEEYKKRTSSERCNKRIKEDFLLEDGSHRSTKMWYCRLYCIMMCQHLDAWGSAPSTSLKDIFAQAA